MREWPVALLVWGVVMFTIAAIAAGIEQAGKPPRKRHHRRRDW